MDRTQRAFFILFVLVAGMDVLATQTPPAPQQAAAHAGRSAC